MSWRILLNIIISFILNPCLVIKFTVVLIFFPYSLTASSLPLRIYTGAKLAVLAFLDTQLIIPDNSSYIRLAVICAGI